MQAPNRGCIDGSPLSPAVVVHGAHVNQSIPALQAATVWRPVGEGPGASPACRVAGAWGSAWALGSGRILAAAGWREV